MMAASDDSLATLSHDDDAPRTARFVVGIDLGTTNSALCFVDTHKPEMSIECFPVRQLVAAGEVASRETLPSFYYAALPDETAAGILKLPWTQSSKSGPSADSVVGVYARDHGRSLPGRLIESAKSWLCHAGVDRRAALLPWHAADDVQQLSPVQASARYLQHLRDAWDADHPTDPLHQQDVVLTIPASFDEVARELTVAAARLAGLPRIILIEEPQAAFYSWVDSHRDSWDQIVSPGQKILVCDIGGGTSDFSLIHVRVGEAGKLQFHRVAVGDHLLLGGDNLDLALATLIERRLAEDGRLNAEGRLSPRQWSLLIPACRHAKEILLADNAPAVHTIVLSGSGSRLIGGALQIAVTRDELSAMILEGFLPSASLRDKPAGRQSGFQEFGLPYAADPAITRYLAAFLWAHRSHAAQPGSTDANSSCGQDDSQLLARPDVVLFNGGFFASPVLRDRLIACLRSWFDPLDPGWHPVVLRNERLDLAVARGAAYFGMVRRGVGIRIVAGLARTYYMEVEQPDGSHAALCLIAAGTEAAADPTEIDRDFQIRTSEPVQFPILVSGTRLTDQPGQIIPIDPDQMTSLPPIRTVLTTRRKGETGSLAARISTRLTEIGTLEMWCQQLDQKRRWQLQFDVRSAVETDRDAHGGHAEQSGIVDESMEQLARQQIHAAFGEQASESVDGIAKRIAAELSLSRHDWPPSLLRAIWAALMDCEAARRRNAKVEARWLNLAGFCLRPGFGMAADDWRVEETWKTLKGRLVHGGAACLAEWRILCRRISGGLSSSRQQQLAQPLLTAIRPKYRQICTGRGKAVDYAASHHEASEIWRLLGSLELLDRNTRAELGVMIVDLSPRPVCAPVRSAMIWALGRIGSRVPVYGPLNLVLPAETIAPWVESLLLQDHQDSVLQMTLVLLCRRTDDRFRDISDSLRHRVVRALTQAGARSHLIELVRNGGQLESEEASLILGEALPRGLRIV